MKSASNFKIPSAARWLLARLSAYDQENLAMGDFEEEFGRLAEQSGLQAARRWYWSQVLGSVPPYWRALVLGIAAATANAMKTALRHSQRHKAFSAINLAGLAAGMACTLFIAHYILHESRYDHQHLHADRIMRVALSVESEAGVQRYAINVPPLAPYLSENCSEVETAARVFQWFDRRVVRHGGELFEEQGFVYADNEIFDILNIPFLDGNARTALVQPFSLVIPQRLAQKYFGQKSAVGQTLNLDGTDYRISGVVADASGQSHMPVDLFVSMTDLARLNWMQDWTWPGMYTYVRLREGVTAAAFEQTVTAAMEKQLAQQEQAGVRRFRPLVQPVKDIYLHSNLDFDMVSGSLFNLRLFSGVGCFILLIACFNFINLSTARAGMRSREVALRKTVGATRTMLLRQFWTESWFLTSAALLFAVLLVWMTAPMYTQLTGVVFSLGGLLDSSLLSVTLIIWLVVALLAGGYPAMMLSRFTPSVLFRSQAFRGRSGQWLRRILVLLQFAVAIGLAGATLVVRQQLQHMQHLSLGFEQDRRVVLAVRGRRPLEQRYFDVREALARVPGIRTASAISQPPGQGAGSLATRLLGENENQNRMMNYTFMDDASRKTLGFTLKAGRWFNAGREGDVESSCLINERAVEAFGWHTADEALGQQVVSGLEGKTKTIVGVVQDYHIRDLYTAIEPLVVEFEPAMFNHIVCELEESGNAEVMSELKAQWHSLFPDQVFIPRFLSDILGKAYDGDRRLNRLVALFAALGLGIAALGVLGLSAFMAQRRFKEVGVRKVLGASQRTLIWLLTWDFTRWVLLANVLAWPVLYWVMSGWMRSFPYRAPLSAAPALWAGLGALAMAWGTAALQALKAARGNPVESLKSE